MAKKRTDDRADKEIIHVKAEVQKRVDTGELNPVEAGEELDRLVRNSPSKE